MLRCLFEKGPLINSILYSIQVSTFVIRNTLFHVNSDSWKETAFNKNSNIKQTLFDEADIFCTDLHIVIVKINKN
jgi:hypothetical protein